MKAKYFVGFIALFSLYASLGGARDGVAHWTHLGGLVTGFLYLKHGDTLTARLGGLRKRWRRKGLKAASGGADEPSRRASRRRDRLEGDRLDEVDRILDKIRESGIDALTPKEREFLDDMSRRYRGSG